MVFFFVQSFGIPIFLLQGVEWFLSSYFFTVFVLIPIILRFKNEFVLYYAPIAILLLFGFIISRHGHLVAYCMKHEFISAGMLRSFADMLVGCVCFKIVCLLKNKKNAYFIIYGNICFLLAIF